MNAIELARQAYAPSSFHLKTDRSVEAQAIGRITARLRVADEQKTNNFSAFAQAVHENRQLWDALSIDVIDDDNALPDHLRAQVFYLAQFTQQHSAKVLKGEATVAALIDINTAVMRGLNAEQPK